MDILLILVTVFVLFAWSRAFLRFKDKAIRPREFIFWTIIWSGVVILTAFRTKLSFIADSFGINRPVDVIIYFSIVLLFYLLFRLYVKIDSLEQSMTKVVRETAIKQARKK